MLSYIMALEIQTILQINRCQTQAYTIGIAFRGVFSTESHALLTRDGSTLQLPSLA